MGGSVRSFVEAAEQLVLESQGEAMVPVESEKPFVDNLREKCIETRLQFAGGLSKSDEGGNGFGIDDPKPGNDFMSEEIAGDGCVVVGLIVSIEDAVFRGIEKYLSLREGKKRPDVCTGKRFDADKPGDARPFCDSIEKSLHLVIRMVRCDDAVGVMFFAEQLEPGPPYVSRALLDGRFGFFSLFPDIRMEHFEGEAMRLAILPDELFVMIGAFPQTVVHMGYHNGGSRYVLIYEQAEEDHGIRSAGTGDDAFFATCLRGNFRDIFQEGVFLAGRHGDIVSIFLQCEEKCARL